MMRAAGTIVLCGAVLATASPALADPRPQATLRIVVVVKDRPPKAVLLTCDPDGGGHPTPAAACELLRKVDGDPAKLNVVPNPVCTDEYERHTVLVGGRWRGRMIKWSHTYSNSCRMKAAGGAVFTF
ncbi:SSI family serine proteinase inhibitor [Nonomuraea sp. NPDC026600]|uniref:SSI family serine proteinase inhibitor n=1 Tax=Nonomuraea sp. NPDC026600 TaxID=3155363 RepID=UPI0033E9AAAC